MKNQAKQGQSRMQIPVILVSLGVILAAIVLHWQSHTTIRSVYVEHMRTAVVQVKTAFLRDTVNNMIVEIDRLRFRRQQSFVQEAARVQQELQQAAEVSEEKLLTAFRSRSADPVLRGQWLAVLWDEETGEVLAHSPMLGEADIAAIVLEPSILLAVYGRIQHGPLAGVVGIPQHFIDQTVQEEIGEMIRQRVFTNHSSVWVDQIIDDGGGEAYFTRRFQGGSAGSEGMDPAAGVEISAGILPDFQGFSSLVETGQFSAALSSAGPDSEEWVEQLIYVMYYPPFDWAVGMGIGLYDLAAVVAETDAAVQTITREWIRRWALYIFIAVLLGLLTIHILQRRNLSRSIDFLEQKNNLDELTRTFSRRYGEKLLADAFARFQKTGEGPAILLLDMDNFKAVNDRYGHAAGDSALKAMVNSIRHTIRRSDTLIRWGGDEFVGVIANLEPDAVPRFTDKLIHVAASQVFYVNETTVQLTISVGLSYFQNDDKSWEDALYRADTAMYKAKEKGKNRAYWIT